MNTSLLSWALDKVFNPRGYYRDGRPVPPLPASAQRKLLMGLCAAAAVVEVALVPLIGTHAITALSTLPGLGWAYWYLHTHPEQVEANIASMSGPPRDFAARARSAGADINATLKARQTVGEDMAPSKRLKSHAERVAGELDLKVDYVRSVENSSLDIDLEVVTWYAVLITGRGSYREKVEIPAAHNPGSVEQAWGDAFGKLGVNLDPPWRGKKKRK